MENPKSISDCVEAVKSQQLHINVLVNNAGVSMVHTYIESPTGVEKTCQTNYLGIGPVHGADDPPPGVPLFSALLA